MKNGIQTIIVVSFSPDLDSASSAYCVVILENVVGYNSRSEQFIEKNFTFLLPTMQKKWEIGNH